MKQEQVVVQAIGNRFLAVNFFLKVLHLLYMIGIYSYAKMISVDGVFRFQLISIKDFLTESSYRAKTVEYYCQNFHRRYLTREHP